MNAGFLLHHLWQSTAFAAGTALLAWALRRRQARVRFGVWLAASVKFLVPFSALVAVGRWLPWAAHTDIIPGVVVDRAAPVVRAMGVPFGVQSIPVAVNGSGHVGFLAALLIGVWGAGAIMLLARWGWRWLALARMARGAETRDMDGLRVAICDGALEPGVFGILRPVLLLPRGLEERLTSGQLAGVIAHERCHVRRQDNLWSALHTLVECLFWFHPLVWWLGQKLVEERERACDEAVLAAGGDREAYACGIITVCRYYGEMPAACAAGVSGGGLRKRVAGILRGQWGARLSGRQKAGLCGLGALVVALPLLVGLVAGQTTRAAQFDAASIRPAKINLSQGFSVGIQIDPQHLRAENVNLSYLLTAVFQIDYNQLKAPRWVFFDRRRYDISAETSAPVSRAQMLALLLSYLTRQFGLTYHRLATTVPIYRLEIASGGTKMRPSGPGTKAWDRGGPYEGHNRLQGAMTMAIFAKVIQGGTGRPVVDATGLKGLYDFDLQTTYSRQTASGGAASTSNPGATAGTTLIGAPPLAEALTQELGLKLVPATGPMDYVVIDSVSRTPLGN